MIIQLRKADNKGISVLVYFAISMLLLINIINNTMITISYPIISSVMWKMVAILRIVLIMLAAIHLSNRHYTARKIVFLMIYIFVVLMAYLSSENWTLFDTFFISLFFSDTLDYNKIIKLFLCLLTAGLVVTVVFDYLGVFIDYEFLRDNGMKRYNLGFNHPNSLGKTVMTIAMLCILKDDKRVGILKAVLILFIVIWIYLVPNSNTSAIVLGLLLLLELTLKPFKSFLFSRDNSMLCALISGALPFILVLIIYMVINVGLSKRIISDLPTTLYARLLYGKMALSEYGFSLFGQPVEFANEITINYLKTADRYFTIDCLYIYLPIVIGVIPTSVFMIYYSMCILNCFRKKDFSLLMVLIVMLIYCVLESAITLFMFNYIFICAMAEKKRFKKSRRVVI